MKHLYRASFSLLFLGIIGMATSTLRAQCTLTLEATDSTFCAGDSTLLTATAPSSSSIVTTTFAGGNNQRGNMFDITAINTVIIQSFDGHPMGNTDYAIYYKVGSQAGFETNGAAWTLIGTASGVVAQPFGTPTPLPIPVGITIPAGQTYAFYVTSTNIGVSQNYTDGTTFGAVYASDANIQFKQGTGGEYPFGSPFSPRVWNGRIHYTQPATLLWSTGATTSTLTVMPSSTTTYTCTYSNPAIPCTITDSITITVNPLPVVDLGLDTALCAPADLTLDAGHPGATYDWSTLDSTQTLLVNASGTYSVWLSDTNGCEGADTISIVFNASPTVSLPADTSLCPDEWVLIDAGPGSTWMWSNGDTTQTDSLSGADAGTIWVLVTDSNGCFGSDTMILGMEPLPVASFSDSPIGLDVTFTNTSTDATSYFWDFGDGSTDTSASPTHSFAGGGSYTVTLIATNDCGSDTATTMILLVAIADAMEQVWTVSPNPNTGNFVIEGMTTGSTQMQVVTSAGNLLWERSAIPSNGFVRQVVELEDAAAGIYLILITSDGRTSTRKIVIQ